MPFILLGQANGPLSTIDSLWEQDQTTEALALLDEVLADSTKADVSEHTLAYQKKGDIHRALQSYELAYAAYIQALRLVDDEQLACVLQMKAGAICGTIAQNEQAFSHFEQALSIAEALNNTKLIAQACNNIGLTYLQQEKYMEARANLLRSYQIRARSNGPAHRLAITLNNLGLVYERLSQSDSALMLYRKAFQLRKAARRSPDEIAQSLQNIGVVYLQMGKADSAYHYLMLAKNQLTTIESAEVAIKVYGNLSQYFWEQRDLDSAKFYLDKVAHVEQQIYQQETGKEVLDLNARYRVAEKDEEIENLGTRLARMLGQRNTLIAGSLILTLTALFIWLFYRQRQQSLKALAEKNTAILNQQIDELLKNQELKAINAMLAGQEHERKRIAEDLHDRLGSQLSAVKLHFESLKEGVLRPDTMEKLGDMLDDAVTEVRSIAHNMLSGILDKFGLVAALKDLVETLTIAGKMEVKLMTHGIDDRLPGELELNIYRVIQELLSNVMKHAGASEVLIQLNKFENELVLTVEDNGIGFVRESAAAGMGLKNIYSRMEQFHGKVHIDSGQKNGTSVTIEIELT